MRFRFPWARAAVALVAIGLGACGSVGGKLPVDGGGAGGGIMGRGGISGGDGGGSGASGQGGAGGSVDAGGVGGAAGAGGQGGAGGSTSSSVRVRGGIEAVGPSPAGAIQIVRAGLTYPRTSVCNGNGSVCVSGGIAP